MKPQSSLSTLISSTAVAALATVVSFAAVGAQAQPAPATAAPAAPPPAAPPAPPATEPAPAPAPAPEAAPAPAPAVAPAEGHTHESHVEAMGREEPMSEAGAPAEEAAPAAEDASAKPISVGAWGRTGLRLQGPGDPKKLKHLTLDETTLELHFDGNATNEIGLTGNVIGQISPGDQNGTVELLDVIARFDIDDAFHVWGGRMLVPSDRANFSGAWFAAPWYYPGTWVPGQYVGPRAQGPNGRNDGVTVWGQIEGGLFKYYLSAFDLHDGVSKPWWTARLNLSLINPEPGYYHSSTYYGGKDLLAIGVAFATKKDGSTFTSTPAPTMANPMPASVTVTDDAHGFNADVLFEKNLQDAGVIDLEGAFYLYAGDYDAFKHSFLLVGSWMTAEKVGPGKIQPLVRFQQAKLRGIDETATSFEIQIGYPIAEYGARLALGYQNTNNAGVKGNAIFLGAQILK
jgi:hypothetical protein